MQQISRRPQRRLTDPVRRLARHDIATGNKGRFRSRIFAIKRGLG